MKKIFLAFAACAVALGFSSCKETWEENPVLKTHDGIVEAQFLNEPSMKTQPLMITKENRNGSLNLTCSQPDYGVACIASYRVQVALSAEDFAAGKFFEIKQNFYKCDQINPVNGDVAEAMEELLGIESEKDLPIDYRPIFIRLRSFIEQDEEHTQYVSNIVQFDAIGADYYARWTAGEKVDIYIRGDMNGWLDGGDMATLGPKWQFETDVQKNTYVVKNVTIEPGQSFKIADATWGSINMGSAEGNENAKADILKVDEEYQLNDGNNPGHLRVDATFTGNVYLFHDPDTGSYYLTLKK